MNPSRLFIERPVATTVLAVALVAFGLVSFLRLPVNDLPTVDFPTISVTAALPGADPETMANAVATPLERQFATIAGLDSMSSVNSAGSTRITLQFALDRNIDAAAQDVQTAMAQAAGRLPPDMDPPMLRKVNPSDAPILFLAFTSKALPLSQLDEVAETRVAQRLSMLSGVAQVLVFGSQKYAVRVYVDPNALNRRGLSLDRVIASLQAANSNVPSGLLRGKNHTFTVSADGQLENAAGFNNTIIAYQNGAPVFLRDVGHAVDSVENDRIATWFNGERAIVLAVQRQPGANTVAVVDAIRTLLPQLEAQLPGDARIHILFDRSDYIRASIHEVNLTLVLAVLFVTLVILGFLQNWSSTLITALILPTSIFGTFALMDYLGFSLNNLSLMGLILAVGFVVDDAIVVLENITRHIEQGRRPFKAAIDGAREIGFTVLSMTLSLVAVFIPILLMGGMLGRLFREFAVTVGAAVLLSGVISLTLTPMLCSRFLRARHAKGRAFEVFERTFERLRGAYARSLAASLERRGLMLLVSAVAIAFTAVLALLVPKGFIPRQDTGLIFGNTRAAEGVSYDELRAKQIEVTDIVRCNPNVASVMSSAGQGLGGVTGTNIGRIVVRLKPRAQRRDSADDVIAQIRRATAHVSGIQVFLQNPPAINIGSMIGQADFQLVLQGTDTRALYAEADRLEAKLKRLPMLRDVNSDLQLRDPQVQVHIERERAATLGVSPQAIESALYNAYGGRRITTLYTPVDQYSVILELDDQYQRDVNALNALYVPTAAGGVVPLGAVARVGTGVGPISVSHYDQLPAVTLSFNIARGAAVGDAVTQIQKEAGVLPAGVSMTFSGSAKAFQQSMRTLPILLLITIAVIYMILAILYENAWHPVTILTALPLAGFGALLTLLVTGNELNIFSFVGIILLVGLVKKNGIMMVDFAITLQRDQNLSARDAIYQASLIRVRPIMMTTVAAILATLPIALGFGAGAETRRPLGIAVVGGLLFSQILTLYVTPAFYVSMDRLRARLKAKRGEGGSV